MQNNLPEPRIAIKPSAMLAGEVGIFALSSFEIGDIVCDFSGIEDVFISNEEYSALSPLLQAKIREFMASTAGGFFVYPRLDFNTLPTTYYANHSCEGNMGFDADGNLVAIRPILAGEELTYDYGLVDSNPQSRMECLCGTPSCRKVITGEDYRDEAFQKRVWDYMNPDLKHLIQGR